MNIELHELTICGKRVTNPVINSSLTVGDSRQVAIEAARLRGNEWVE